MPDIMGQGMKMTFGPLTLRQKQLLFYCHKVFPNSSLEIEFVDLNPSMGRLFQQDPYTSPWRMTASTAIGGSILCVCFSREGSIIIRP